MAAPERTLTTAGGGSVALPLFLPVYQQNADAPDVRSFGGDPPVRGCIVNAYFLYKRRELRERLRGEQDLHDYLGFDRLVMTDSGAFQAFTRRLLLSNRSIVAFQDAIGSDVVSPLDLVTPPGESRATAERKLEATAKRVREAQRYVTRAVLAGVQQGGRFLDLRRRGTDQMLRLGVGYLAIGSLVPFFTRRHELSFAGQVVRAARERAGAAVPIHVYGAGDPLELPFFVLWGADVFDSSSYVHYARKGRYMTPYGALEDPGPLLAGEWACRCPACATRSDIRTIFADTPALAAHNLRTILDTVRAAGDAHRAGTLEAMLEQLVDVNAAWFPDSLLRKAWEARDG
ncbi:MAG TPA: tRNA-guanine transglycosylase [Actinomycetes bacterium]|nr:tRNA-guanine transglycosylase [Actinomycetes bacterium]